MLAGSIRQQLASYLADRLDALVAGSWAKISAEVPEYRVLASHRTVRARVESDIRAVCEAAIVELVGAPAPRHGSVINEMRRIARKCLEEGIDADSLRLAVRISVVTAVELVGPFLREASYSGGDQAEASALLAELFACHDDLITVVQDFHTQLRLRAPALDRRLSAALDDLFDGRFYSEDAIRRRSTDAGYDLHGAHGLVLVSLPTQSDHRQHLRALAAPFLKALPRGCATAYRHPDGTPHLAVLVSRDAYSVVAALAHRKAVPAGLLVVLVPPVAGPRDLHQAYAEVAALLPFLQRLLPAHVLTRNDLAVYVLLASIPADAAQQYASAIFRDVLKESGDRSKNLVKTLSTYYRSSSKRTTALQLKIGARTVEYRLHRIRQLTGLDPDTERPAFEMALRLLPLSAPHLRSEAVPFPRVDRATLSA